MCNQAGNSTQHVTWPQDARRLNHWPEVRAVEKARNYYTGVRFHISRTAAATPPPPPPPPPNTALCTFSEAAHLCLYRHTRLQRSCILQRHFAFVSAKMKGKQFDKAKNHNYRNKSASRFHNDVTNICSCIWVDLGFDAACQFCNCKFASGFAAAKTGGSFLSPQN